jgi:prepilin-type N-terminal cleavage/methylation domain-containing protein
MKSLFIQFALMGVPGSLRSPKDRNRGFTILEILVVAIIIGILSAIAWPSMAIFANRAKESEARSYVASINKGQQAHYMQTSSFDDLSSLSLGIPLTTRHYTYTSVGDNVNNNATTTATPSGDMRGFAGQVWLGAMNGEAHLYSIVCEGSAGSVPAIVANTCP